MIVIKPVPIDLRHVCRKIAKWNESVDTPTTPARRIIAAWELEEISVLILDVLSFPCRGAIEVGIQNGAAVILGKLDFCNNYSITEFLSTIANLRLRLGSFAEEYPWISFLTSVEQVMETGE